MTTKQIEKLNVKIAKKLGWKDLKLENTPFETRRTIGIAPGNERHQYVPNYFGNLAYALIKLVDWANSHGYYFELVKSADMKNYEAEFSKWNKCGVESHFLPSTAICLAFLKIK